MNLFLYLSVVCKKWSSRHIIQAAFLLLLFIGWVVHITIIIFSFSLFIYIYIFLKKYIFKLSFPQVSALHGSECPVHDFPFRAPVATSSYSLSLVLIKRKRKRKLLIQKTQHFTGINQKALLFRDHCDSSVCFCF